MESPQGQDFIIIVLGRIIFVTSKIKSSTLALSINTQMHYELYQRYLGK